MCEVVNYYASKVPGLEWFVRGPDGRPVAPSVRGAFLVGGATAEGEGEEPGTPPNRG